MNWFIITLVFHVLKLNLCVASNQVCLDGQYLNASGICVNCTVCKQPDKNVVIRPCSTHADALCGSVSDINIDLPGLSKIKSKKNNYASTFAAKFAELKAEAEAKKSNKALLNKSLEDTRVPIADKPAKDIDEDDDYDEDDYDDYEDTIKTNDTKSTPQIQMTKRPKKTSDFISTKDTFLDPIPESNKPGKQLKKDLNINTLNPINSDPKSIKYSVFSKIAEEDKKKPKDKKKKKAADLDHLKIGDTKFVIVDEKPDDRGRWIPLSHPHIVDHKIYVDLPNDTPKNKKASTFFSSSEKTDNYANEMTKLLNETSSVFDEKIFNQTNSDDQDYDGITKNLDDDDDEEDDSDEDEDDDDDKDDDEDQDDDDDYNLIYNDIVNSNVSHKSDMEKIDPDLDDEYDFPESDNFEDKKWFATTNDDIMAEPFNDSASWQLLILVSAMSACLLFFVVVSAYVCIYMRKRRQFKSNFKADVEDLSARVNLMQHAGFEADDTSNIKNYITQLRGVKSNNEKLPKICTRKK